MTRPNGSPRRMRTTQRLIHLVGGLLLLVYLYLPWSETALFGALVRIVVVPALVGTGLAMWQLPRLRRWRAARGVARQRLTVAAPGGSIHRD